MKKTLPHLVYILFLFGTVHHVNAQQFSSGEQTIIKPSQVIIENYIPIYLSKETIDDVSANRFDINNPYTYLQIVTDVATNRYHILFQTNFAGKILFLSYSNNLSGVFNKSDKPVFMLTRCLKEINNHLSSVQIMNAAINCVIERLNYCYSN